MVTIEGHTSDETWQPSELDTSTMDVVDMDIESKPALVVNRKLYTLLNFAMKCNRYSVLHRAAQN